MEDDKFLALKVIKTESKEGSPSFCPIDKKYISRNYIDKNYIDKNDIAKMTL